MYNEVVADHAAAWALSKVGCEYSQEKRTEASFFDCSSLVARAYSAQGKKWMYGGSVPLSNQEVYDDDFELVWPESYSQIGKVMGGKQSTLQGIPATYSFSVRTAVRPGQTESPM